MTVTTKYPDAHPEDSSVDGGAAANSVATSGDTWQNMHDRSGDEATVADNNAVSDTMIRAHSNTNKYDIWRRAIVVFDPPGISAGDTITAVTIQWINQSVTHQFSGSINIVPTTTASVTEINAGDYDGGSTVRQVDSDILLSNLNTGNNNLNTFTLNSTGVGNTSKDAVSKWMFRLKDDIDDDETTWIFEEQDQFRMLTADEAESGDQRPRINITHATAFTPKVIMF
jgi:hypothetical protein